MPLHFYLCVVVLPFFILKILPPLHLSLLLLIPLPSSSSISPPLHPFLRLSILFAASSFVSPPLHPFLRLLIRFSASSFVSPPLRPPLLLSIRLPPFMPSSPRLWVTRGTRLVRHLASLPTAIRPFLARLRPSPAAAMPLPITSPFPPPLVALACLLPCRQLLI